MAAGNAGCVFGSCRPDVGSTSAILGYVPGEPLSVLTALEGYKMAQRGMAGRALATAAIASFFARTVSTFLIVLYDDTALDDIFEPVEDSAAFRVTSPDQSRGSMGDAISGAAMDHPT
jgi:hypothetical protein